MRRQLFLFLLVFISFRLFADSLTLEQVRLLALVNSRSLARYHLAVQSNVLSERIQRYNDGPSFSLGAQAQTDLWTANGFSPERIQDKFRAGASFNISQDLWNGGKNAIRRAINSLSTEISRQEAMAEFHSVLNSADSMYYEVLKAQAALEAADSSLATAALSLEMAEIRRRSGMISEADYLQALAEMAARETTRNQNRRDLAVANIRLNDLLGLDETPALAPVDFVSQEALILLLSNSNDNAINRLYTTLWRSTQDRNPSMIRASLRSQSSDKSVGLTTRDYSPTLSASLSTGLFTYTINNGFDPAFAGQLSLRASFPIDVWKISADVERQKIAREQTALDYRIAVSSLDIELRTLILDLVSQAGQILSSRRALDYAQKHFDYVFELYRLSRNSTKDLSDAETMVRDNRNRLNSSQYSFLTGLSRIRSIGVFDSDEEIIALITSILE